jgi:hypothetical protein
MPHGFCYLWNEALVLLHTISDGVIAIAYILIAAALYTLASVFGKQMKALRLGLWFHLFGAFIFLCAVTHILAVVVVFHPFYWVEGWTKAATAIVSATTALLLYRVMYLVFKNHVYEVPIKKTEPWLVIDVPKELLTTPKEIE